MKYRQLGRTTLCVSELGFGAFGIGGSRSGNSFGPTDDRQSCRAISRALELGCTLFDTADVYGIGHSERLLGRMLPRPGAAREVIVATKGGCLLDGSARQDFTPSYLLMAVEASLRRLRRDTIDLYQLHNPPLSELQSGAVFDALQALTRSGKVRHAGVSVHTFEEAAVCVQQPACDSIQIVYNVFSLLQEAARWSQLFAAAARAQCAIIAREPLANGFLAGHIGPDHAFDPSDYRRELGEEVRRARSALAQCLRPRRADAPSPAQLALRFVLDEPAITTTLVGIKTTSHVEQNIAATQLTSFAALYATHVGLDADPRSLRVEE